VGAFITLTTDFGLTDGYAAALKGVIYSLNPEATVVDIGHNILPGNVREAAFLLRTVYHLFPTYTVHLVIVDPGVGTNRRAIILKTSKYHFVGPDNGVFSYILDAFPSQPLPDSQSVKPGPDVKAYAITKSDYWRKPVSATFHGRDIFAPVAARLSLGMPASSLGDNVDTVTAFTLPVPFRQPGLIRGRILHIDNFGNLITNLRESDLSEVGQSATIILGDQLVRGVVRTYADKEGPVALIGSSGYLEIAVGNGNAAELFRARVGDEVRLETGVKA
jgi:S-adenosyl-L-methionine hydrolase (adenosine-forming)